MRGASHTNTGTNKYTKTPTHKCVDSFKVLLGGFGSDCNGLQKYMMLLGPRVHRLLSLGVCGVPTWDHSGRLWSFIGYVGHDPLQAYSTQNGILMVFGGPKRYAIKIVFKWFLGVQKGMLKKLSLNGFGGVQKGML